MVPHPDVKVHVYCQQWLDVALVPVGMALQACQQDTHCCFMTVWSVDGVRAVLGPTNLFEAHSIFGFKSHCTPTSILSLGEISCQQCFIDTCHDLPQVPISRSTLYRAPSVAQRWCTGSRLNPLLYGGGGKDAQQLHVGAQA